MRTRTRNRQLWLIPLLSCSLCLPLLGCGQSGPGDGPPGDPFDPGKRPGGGEYGSGSGGMPQGPPMCAETERRCQQEFSYAGSAMMPLTGKEDGVFLQGDYKENGWDVKNGDPLTFDGKVWKAMVPVPWNSKMLYKFRITYKDMPGGDKWIADPGNPQGEDDGFGGKNSVLSGVTCAKWTCAPAKPMCMGPMMPGTYDWRDAVLYFVFVDRFNNGDPTNDKPVMDPGLKAPANWQGGDWAGVTQKIKEGYFNGLGVNTLWISMPTDQTDSTGIGDDGQLYSAYHGYWPRDLTKPEPRFGTETELKNLVTEAHKANLKVLVDYVMNHVHQDSPVWKMHPDWFNPLMVAGQKCICGSALCGWDGMYAKSCWFRDYLPDFNFNVLDARKYSVGNAIDWVKRSGIDGFRLDAVKHIEVSWLEDLRSRLTTDIEPMSKQHVYLVGETFTGDRNLIKGFIDPCKTLDGQFDFPLRATLNRAVLMRQGKMQELVTFMDSNTSFYGSGLMSTFLGNHDVPRSIHFAQDTPLWGDVWADGKDKAWMNQPKQVTGQSAYERLGLAMTVLMTNRGVPLIYYGDEIGQPGAGDPDNRRFMQWSGYSAEQTWLLDRVKKLGTVRAAHGALRHGDRKTLSSDDDTWAYQMTEGTDQVYVVINRSDLTKMVPGLPAGNLKEQLTGATLAGPTVMVPPRGALILTP